MAPKKVLPKPKQVMEPKRDMSPKSLATYKRTMEYLTSPQCSYTVLYEPHLVTFNKKKNKKNTNATKPKKNNTKPPKPKKDTPKKVREKFLNNVKTLTQSGMLDGVAVRYISKTKKLEIPGKIQGPCYLCGCEACNYTKTINAYEFENHAGCKTSHPNNHIHFENGKTMHTVVMELNTTPEDALFHALNTLTGASIDQKSFSAWKESFN